MPDVELRGGEVDGISLHYVVAGRGPAVVLVHGLGGFAESWRYTVEALAGRATVYALDLPGFGRSSKPHARYALSYFARALHGFMDALEIGSASLVGHSLGAAVSMTYALTHPSRVARVAIVGGLVPGFPYRLSWLARCAAVEGIGELLSLCGSPRLYKASIARCFHERMPTEVDFLVDSFYAERTTPEARAAFLATVRHIDRELVDRLPDYRRALATVDVPVLLIHGRQDRVVPARHAAAAAAGIPLAALRWIDRCGHFPQIEHAGVVNGWLGEFVVGRTAPR